MAEQQFKTTGPAIREAPHGEIAAQVRERAAVVIRQIKPQLESLEALMAQLEELRKATFAPLPAGAMGFVRFYSEKWRHEPASFSG
jgi:hypothetical protein